MNVQAVLGNGSLKRKKKTLFKYFQLINPGHEKKQDPEENVSQCTRKNYHGEAGTMTWMTAKQRVARSSRSLESISQAFFLSPLLGNRMSQKNCTKLFYSKNQVFIKHAMKNNWLLRKQAKSSTSRHLTEVQIHTCMHFLLEFNWVNSCVAQWVVTQAEIRNHGNPKLIYFPAL